MVARSKRKEESNLLRMLPREKVEPRPLVSSTEERRIPLVLVREEGVVRGGHRLGCGEQAWSWCVWCGRGERERGREREVSSIRLLQLAPLPSSLLNLIQASPKPQPQAQTTRLTIVLIPFLIGNPWNKLKSRNLTVSSLPSMRATVLVTVLTTVFCVVSC